jgi:hypothetical protein
MAAIVPASVGVISSIACGESFSNAFESALKDAFKSVPVTYFDQVGYDNQLLQHAVESFNFDKSVGLIVTFGGKIAFSAADQYSTQTQFISLIGDTPVPANNLCLGGVSLGTYARNQPSPNLTLPVTFMAGSADVGEASNSFAKGDPVSFISTGNLPNDGAGQSIGGRLFKVVIVGAGTFRFADYNNTVIIPASAGTGNASAHLVNRVGLSKLHTNSASGDISLLYNSSSPLARDELIAWQQSDWPKWVPADDHGTPGPAVPINVRKSFNSAFDSIETPVVIVSADPYFQDNKDGLIQAANASGKFVCYPLNNYRNKEGTHRPAGGRSILFGPRLEDAIKLMGTLAAARLQDGTRPATAFTTAAYPAKPYFP